jgi:hypothetical protein
MAIQPSGEEVQLAAVVTAPPPMELKPAVLPATSSTLPLIALGGLLALGGALSLRLLQKRIV